MAFNGNPQGVGGPGGPEARGEQGDRTPTGPAPADGNAQPNPSEDPLRDPRHRQHLLDELGSPEGVEVAIRYGARSVTAREAAAMDFRLRAKPGQPTNSTVRDHGGRRHQFSSGLYLPFRDGWGQLRCDDPPLAANGRPCKYLNRARKNQTIAVFGEGDPVVATEGWKDALRIHLATGLTVAAIAGVWSYRLLPPSVRWIVYDADAALNPGVWGPLVRAGLERPGLRLAFFPAKVAGPKGGVVEFFRNGGTAEQFQQRLQGARSPRKLLEEISQEWSPGLKSSDKTSNLHKLAELALKAGIKRMAMKDMVRTAATRMKVSLRDAEQVARNAIVASAEEKASSSGSSFQRTEEPIDTQAARLLAEGELGRAAHLRDRVYRYDEEKGYWRPLSVSEQDAAALRVLKRIWVLDKEGAQRFPFGSRLQQRNARELLPAELHGRPHPIPLAKPAPVIVFGNGTYLCGEHRLVPHSPDHGATFALECDYPEQVPDRPPAPLRRVIETCYPEGAEFLIRGALRFLLDPTAPFGRFPFFVGASGTGKGLILQLGVQFFPQPLLGTATHPGDFANSEKIAQVVAGHPIVAIEDMPIHRSAHKDSEFQAFYSLVEAAPRQARRLGITDAEATTHFCRFLVAAVGHPHFTDAESRAGWHRRALPIATLPRLGEQDPSLKEDLLGHTDRHRQLRGQIAAWALSMPDEAFRDFLRGRDPEGLLAEAAADAEVDADTVSRWADACLVPHPLGPDTPVSEVDWQDMFRCYQKWGEWSGVKSHHLCAFDTFKGKAREAVGARRHPPRGKESRAAARAAGRDPSRRRNTPDYWAGFALRPGLFDEVGVFNPVVMGQGGLAEIRQLPPARRFDDDHFGEPPGSRPPKGPPSGSGGGSRSETTPGDHPSEPPASDPDAASTPAGGDRDAAGRADLGGEAPPVSGPVTPPVSGPVSDLAESATSVAVPGRRGSSSAWSQTFPSSGRHKREKTEEGVPKEEGDARFFSLYGGPKKSEGLRPPSEPSDAADPPASDAPAAPSDAPPSPAAAGPPQPAAAITDPSPPTSMANSPAPSSAATTAADSRITRAIRYAENHPSATYVEIQNAASRAGIEIALEELRSAIPGRLDVRVREADTTEDTATPSGPVEEAPSDPKGPPAQQVRLDDDGRLGVLTGRKDDFGRDEIRLKDGSTVWRSWDQYAAGAA